MLQLTPDKPKKIPNFPDENADTVREPTEVLALDGPLNIPEKAISTLRIRTGHFTLNVAVNTLRKADRLVVTFMGARGGVKDVPGAQRPMFARRNWDALFECPILAISDPLAEREWDAAIPRTGFYFGDFEHDLVPEINALIDAVCDELNIMRRKVVLYGACAGATAALLVACRRKRATGVIAVNPLLRPDRYRTQTIEVGARAAGGDLAAWEEMSATAPWRNNPLTALKDALQDGIDLRVVVAQNVKDKTTVNRHFPGFWRRFDISPEGGVSPNGRLMAALYSAPEDADSEHEPRAFSRPLVQLAYDFFSKPLVVVSKKDRKAGAGASAPDETQGAERVAAVEAAGSAPASAAPVPTAEQLNRRAAQKQVAGKQPAGKQPAGKQAAMKQAAAKQARQAALRKSEAGDPDYFDADID